MVTRLVQLQECLLAFSDRLIDVDDSVSRVVEAKDLGDSASASRRGLGLSVDERDQLADVEGTTLSHRRLAA